MTGRPSADPLAGQVVVSVTTPTVPSNVRLVKDRRPLSTTGPAVRPPGRSARADALAVVGLGTGIGGRTRPVGLGRSEVDHRALVVGAVDVDDNFVQ